MVKKVVWTQRILPKDKDYLDSVLDAYRIGKGLESKGAALIHFVRNRAGEVDEDSGALIPEIHYPDEKEFEATCPFGFLKLLSDKYGREELWHCLKQQGPNSKGQPVVLANGRDKGSIRTICEACQINWQRDPKNIDQVRIAFQQLGERKISSILYFCLRDALGEGFKLNSSENGQFFCLERGRKVVIKNTCIDKKCPYLATDTISLDLAGTIPYQETQKALEALQ